METKTDPEAIKKIIGKLENSSDQPQSQSSSEVKQEDEKVKQQIEGAVEKAAQDPDASQG